jgi:hypothetical protein
MRAARSFLVQACRSSGPRPAQNGPSRTGGTLIIDDFFMGAADNLVGHDDRLGSGLGNERRLYHLMRGDRPSFQRQRPDRR